MSTIQNTTHVEAPVRLSPISYVVLGVIGLRGPSTPYQLKQAVEHSVRYFWPFPHSQLYGEPERLAGAGLLDQEVEEGGRRRRVYSLTSSGQQVLENWLKTPPGEVFEMRDMAVLQLFFSEFASTVELVKLAEDQVRLYQERLAVYQAIIEYNEGREWADRRMAPLDLGVRMATACLEFWSDIAANPPPGREPSLSR
ncbi:PadR family transcriptional regulator [Paraburkholderia oxyphila]|uniref:PadR family transcriptional regulator n=1 Tax=Paraburkholderia oxyphila TaxID=614212 RepID=UPI000484059B|nr:PadR family transcriptional regulator [Paraburkholderia oxyphila]